MNIKKEPNTNTNTTQQSSSSTTTTRSRAPNISAALNRRRARSPTNTSNNNTDTSNITATATQQQDIKPNIQQQHNRTRQQATTTFAPSTQSSNSSKIIRAVANNTNNLDNINTIDIKQRIQDATTDIKSTSIKTEYNDIDIDNLPVTTNNIQQQPDQPITLPFNNIHDIEASQHVNNNSNISIQCPVNTPGYIIETNQSSIDDNQSQQQPKLLLIQLPTALPVISYKQQQQQSSTSTNIKTEPSSSTDTAETIINSNINDSNDSSDKSTRQQLIDSLNEYMNYSHITEYRPDELRLYSHSSDNIQYRTSQLNSGYIGQLQVYRSGRVVMKLGNHEFDIHNGCTGSNYLQQCVVIDEQNKRYIPLANIQHTLVTSMAV